MESGILADLKSGLNEAIAAGGEIVKTQGLDIPALVDSVEIMTEMETGNFVPQTALVVVFPLDAVPETPKSGNKITVRDAIYRMKKVDQDEISFTMTCIDKNR